MSGRGLSVDNTQRPSTLPLGVTYAICPTCGHTVWSDRECLRCFGLGLDAARVATEVCICAAIKMHDGYVVRGHRHADCLRTAAGIPRYEIKSPDRIYADQGFVTSTGRFVDRVEGAKLQIAAGVVSACPELPYLNGELYSEDLY